MSFDPHRVVCWEEPHTTDILTKTSLDCVIEAKKMWEEKALLKYDNYSDEMALTDWMTINGAWFEGETPINQKWLAEMEYPVLKHDLDNSGISSNDTK